MKIFLELKQNLKCLGIKPVQSESFNAVNLIVVCLFLWCFFTMSAFVMFEAENLIDLGNSFYGVVSALLNTFTFSSIVVMKKVKLFGIIDQFEQVIEKCKLNNLLNFNEIHSIYINEQSKMSKIRRFCSSHKSLRGIE